MSEIDNTRQQEAIERAREMYSRRMPEYRTGGFPNGYKGNIKRRTVGQERREESFPQNSGDDVENITSGDDKKQNDEKNNSESSFLDVLLADKERTLIILLLALLSEEKANTSLMLALMYIIM